MSARLSTIVIVALLLLPSTALAGFDAELQQISYSGSAVVGGTINLKVKAKNLSTPDSGYGGAATFCIQCNVDPPGFWNDFDQEKAGQQFGLYETKTISMPSFVLDDDGDWDVSCEVLSADCKTAFDSLDGFITVGGCQNECSSGEKQCSNSETVYQCVKDDMGCYVWESVACPWKEKCSGGVCVAKSCPELDFPLGECGSPNDDGDCKNNDSEVWRCVDAGPVNCWLKLDTCWAGEVCIDPWTSEAFCIGDGHADYCNAMQGAGSGCSHGQSDCDSNGECLGDLVCSGPLGPTGSDGCCWPGEEWDGDKCLVNDCPALGYPLGECNNASSNGECKSNYSQVWECVDAGPLNCYQKNDTCGAGVCQVSSWDGKASCTYDGDGGFCSAMKVAGTGCAHGQSDCDFDSQCLGELVCSGSLLPIGTDGCCWPGEEWDGQTCLVNDCGALGYPLGECNSPSSAGACKAGFGEVWECIDAGPVNCWQKNEDCGAGVCKISAWDGKASCTYEGDGGYCKAMAAAGSGCDHGEDDCDFDSECLGDLECAGSILPVGTDGCCWPSEGWDGEKCLPNDCQALGYQLGECDFPSNNGACKANYNEVWQCVDAGPINCWEKKQTCQDGICQVSSWDGKASCLVNGDGGYCKALVVAGLACEHGESDCDFNSECAGELECSGSLLPIGVDGCCWPGEEWDGEKCLPGDCGKLGYPLGVCGSPAADGECHTGYAEVWECVDAGPVNCWSLKEGCVGDAICFDAWLGAAKCVPEGDEDYCHAKEAAGTGCSYGQSDCDSDGECVGDLECIGPVFPFTGLDGCCIKGEEWDGEKCSGAGQQGNCPADCLNMGEFLDEFEYTFNTMVAPTGLWSKATHEWHCQLDEDMVATQGGNVVLTVSGGGEKCAQIDSVSTDLFYGSYRASIKTSPNSGTCGAFFFWGQGNDEIDIEILSLEKDIHRVHFVAHPSGEPCGSPTHKCYDMATDPSDGFHTYGFDILPEKVIFFVDEQPVEEITTNIPDAPGNLIISNWTGNEVWTGVPPTQDSHMEVEWIEYVPLGQCDICSQCGNAMVTLGEECDGDYLAGATCETLGQPSGYLACTPDCEFDTIDCAGISSCGDGQCAADEDCLTCKEDCGNCQDQCGDGTCQPGENCANCEPDCGVCCGNGKCEAAYGEDCESCPDDCDACPLKCGNNACDEFESCESCPLDCGQCCGNGKCEPGFGEDCVFCAEDCGNCLEDCGDGVCKPGENCANCPDDCGNCCGNKHCEAAYGEECETCPGDCGACAPTCGDDQCQGEEDCQGCPMDCGECCGDGKCEPGIGEDCVFCPADCGDCIEGCGDGLCGEDEDCASCPADCGNCCGNAKCEPAYGENCDTCEDDCGSCPINCKDGICQDDESCQSCPSDCGACCGNDMCEGDFGEDCMYCPEDCGDCDCIADCTGKQCGYDGCGKACPPGCQAGELCMEGQCVLPSEETHPEAPAGDTLSQDDTGNVLYIDDGGDDKTKSGNCDASSESGTAPLVLPLLLLLLLATAVVLRRRRLR